ncbi:amino acid adenylation domain-containing protein [Nonomuraea sp. B19D2]|uniref:amino acid adenylation domain-containing protein n=1 Tax=Nonomuraea sp. B19D2 TaxID=3159561 RepID=UPI0032DA8DBD
MYQADSVSRLFAAARSPSVHCHAWRVRLSEGADAARMARLLDQASRAWWGEPARLWVENVPADGDSPAARRRLDSELHRPMSGSGPRLRAVLLEYADGPADLVLVAHRERCDSVTLRSVAQVLTGRASYDRFRPEEAGPDAGMIARRGEAGRPGSVEWATGDAAAGDRTGVVTVRTRAAAQATAKVAVALGLVVGRYEDQRDPLLGALAVVPDRPAGALGAFDTGMLLALDLSGQQTVGELVAGSDRTLCGEGGRGDGPRQDLAEPGGRVLAGLVANELDHFTGEGETYLPCQAAPFPLTIALRRAAGGLMLDVHHRLQDVDEHTARRFAHHVARVYEQLIDPADDLVPDDVDLLDEPERRWTVELGRPSRSLEQRPERIEEVFAARVAERPEAVALTCEDRSLTYAELDERAERMAGALRGMGVRAGERVGLCLERSLDLVVTMLAVLKAGAVYVPMDPGYPADRLAFMAQDAGLMVVVAGGSFPDGDQLSIVTPEQLVAKGGGAGTAASDGEAGGSPGPDDAAYVIYTSGSTGRPKGVLVPHRNVVALLSATEDDFGLGPGDTWTNFHSSAFDFSVWEIWGALLTGARLVMVPYWVSRSPEEFHELLVREQVTVLNQTPSAFAQLMDADRRRGERLAVRLVVFGGEPLDARPLRDWFDRYPENRCRVVNMYGITETTVHVTAQTVTRREAMAGSRSVGCPLPGWHVYVLDERGRPVPCGVPGEIYVGGAGVALEYLGRPELTAQRFLPDPFGGGRMYRSGDRGRLRHDGRLEHLGRLDTQVKVRGFRVELDEIRRVLLEDASVTAAAVLPRAGDLEGARIDAYVVLADGDTAAVRRRAARVLPEHMLPATITALPALPLTANGKLDVRALPESAPPASVRAPSDDVVETLTAIWESVLGVPVGADDNFFELGGNSLLAMRLAAAIRERGLPAPPMRELYLHPTVSGLARVLGHE